MNLDALFNQSRDSLASARKSLFDLLEQLRHTGNSQYSMVADVMSSVAKAEEDLDNMAASWVEEAEKNLRGEGVSYSDEVEMLPEARIFEDNWKSLSQLTREQELDFEKFLPPEGNE